MADKYTSTILVNDNTAEEIKKADLNLLKLINDLANNVIIPTVEPTNLVDGSIWISL